MDTVFQERVLRQKREHTLLRIVLFLAGGVWLVFSILGVFLFLWLGNPAMMFFCPFLLLALFAATGYLAYHLVSLFETSRQIHALHPSLVVSVPAPSCEETESTALVPLSTPLEGEVVHLS